MFRHAQSHQFVSSTCIPLQRRHHNKEFSLHPSLTHRHLPSPPRPSRQRRRLLLLHPFPCFSHTPKSLGPHSLSLSHSSLSPPPPSNEINSPPLLLEIGKTRPFLPKRHLPLPSLAEEPRRLRRLLLPHAFRGWKAVSVNRSREHSIAFDSRTLSVINAFHPKR